MLVGFKMKRCEPIHSNLFESEWFRNVYKTMQNRPNSNINLEPFTVIQSQLSQFRTTYYSRHSCFRIDFWQYRARMSYIRLYTTIYCTFSKYEQKRKKKRTMVRELMKFVLFNFNDLFKLGFNDFDNNHFNFKWFS